ncbi:MAG: cytochrome c biogenesis protein [Acidobacteriota bacterium]
MENRNSSESIVLIASRMLSLGRILLWLLLPLMLLAVYSSFVYAPAERVMGEVQRLFYFHMGAAIAAFISFFLVFIAGCFYLWKRALVWDKLALSGVECGVLFTTIVLITGPIWARPVWNTWLPLGDPRVMTTLVLWLIFLAYLLLRASFAEGDKKYRICAVYGIIGFLDVPVVFMSIRWWRSIHPKVISSEGIFLDERMKIALVLALAACVFLLAVLVIFRTVFLLHKEESMRLEDILGGE